MDTQVKKREWVKTAAIIFLSVLLVLTFFSNTILNASLPEVATQQVTSGTINAKIRGTGTVSANETYDVTLSQTRKIESVLVKVGQSVKAGDTLFVLEDAESDEVQTARTDLNSLEADYQRSLITASNDAATKNHNITKLKAAYDEAQTDYDTAKEAYDTQIAGTSVDTLKAEKKTAEAALVTLKADLQTATDKYNDAVADAAEDAEEETEDNNERLVSLKLQISDLEEDIAALQAAIKNNSNRTQEDIYVDIHYYQNEKANLETSNATLLSTYNSDYQAFEKLVGDEMKAYACYKDQLITKIKSSKGLTDEAASALADKYIEAYQKLSQYYTDKATIEQKLKSLNAELSAVTTGSTAELESELEQKQTRLKNLNKQYELASGAANSSSSSAGSSYKKQMNTLNSKISTKEQEISDLTEKISEAETDEQTKKQTLEADEQTMKSAKTAWEDAVFEASLGTTTSIDLQQAKENIALKQAALEKLEKNADAREITAKVGGVISTLNVKAGDNASSDTPLAVISMVDRGFTVKISLTSQQAAKIKVGDSADVVNYWDGNVEADVESIAADTQTKGNKLVTFRLTGDVQADQSITLSIGQKSASYDAIVPNSAIREDNNGKFVLAITSKATPLSTRYTATRVPVEALASDDTQTAISGIGAGEFVITTSTKPIEAGAEVRMAEKK